MSYLNNQPTEDTAETNKKFLLRNVPASLHTRWKVIAAFYGKDMSELAVEAVEALVSVLESRRDKQLHHPSPLDLGIHQTIGDKNNG